MNARREYFSEGTASAEPQSDEAVTPNRLGQCVADELDRYFAMLDGQEPADLHQLVMAQAEEALMRYMMKRYRDNQSRVAEYLGINRGTLRKRLKEYEIT
ncbi:helix-turn-helix domain-containing protein [Granulosicoccaceae sp. 1_MG-2023]|nr:helix-turn-helix domain-containing protein [Granulosicoccaceae sp. 1_MG-2023]